MYESPDNYNIKTTSSIKSKNLHDNIFKSAGTIFVDNDINLIDENVLIKFKLIGEETILPTGTLRPETLFGVTNLWVRPDITYVHVDVDEESWIVSPECADKLKMLNLYQQAR